MGPVIELSKKKNKKKKQTPQFPPPHAANPPERPAPCHHARIIAKPKALWHRRNHHPGHNKDWDSWPLFHPTLFHELPPPKTECAWVFGFLVWCFFWGVLDGFVILLGLFVFGWRMLSPSINVRAWTKRINNLSVEGNLQKIMIIWHTTWHMGQWKFIFYLLPGNIFQRFHVYHCFQCKNYCYKNLVLGLGSTKHVLEVPPTFGKLQKVAPKNLGFNTTLSQQKPSKTKKWRKWFIDWCVYICIYV